jgi:hypothetical protein
MPSHPDLDSRRNLEACRLPLGTSIDLSLGTGRSLLGTLFREHGYSVFFFCCKIPYEIAFSSL